MKHQDSLTLPFSLVSSPPCPGTTTTKWRPWYSPCVPSMVSSTSPSPCSRPLLTLSSEYRDPAGSCCCMHGAGQGTRGGPLLSGSGRGKGREHYGPMDAHLGAKAQVFLQAEGKEAQRPGSQGRLSLAPAPLESAAPPECLTTCPSFLQLSEGVGAALAGRLSSPVTPAPPQGRGL